MPNEERRSRMRRAMESQSADALRRGFPKMCFC